MSGWLWIGIVAAASVAAFLFGTWYGWNVRADEELTWLRERNARTNNEP
jgi:hypothetical protein